MSRQNHFEIGYGYSFEAACLCAESLGIGTVMLAASLSRAAFEKAMDVQADKVMPVASLVGYPAAKRSLRESMMRKALKADDRLPFEQLYFDGGFDAGHKKEQAGVFKEALEMARRAPSDGNKQPRRAVVIDDIVRFYEEKTMKDNVPDDIQKADMGIALAHFDLTMQEEEHERRFIDEDPGLNRAKNMHHIISFERIR